MHTIYHIAEDEENYPLTDLLEMHFIELPKMKNDTTASENQDFYLLMQFLNSTTREEMEMLAKSDTKMKEVVNALYEIEQSDLNWAQYITRYKEILDNVPGRREAALQKTIEKLEKANEKAEECGISIGEKRGMVKVLLMQDKSDEEIEKIVGISTEFLEEIKRTLE